MAELLEAASLSLAKNCRIFDGRFVASNGSARTGVKM